MRRTVTVGVDGSRESLAAAEWAAREAVRRGVPVCLLHAAAPEPGLASPAEPPPQPVTDGWSPMAVADDLRRAHPDAEVTVEQVAGQPLPVLFAGADEAELMVLGSRGTSAAAGFLLGSVPLTVVGQSPVPVVLVRVAPEVGADDAVGTDVAGEDPRRDVVLGLDLARPSDRLLEFAFDAAALRSATLRIAYGWSEAPPDGAGAAGRAEGAGGSGGERGDSGDAGDDGALVELLAPWRERYPRTRVVGEAVAGEAARHLLDASGGAALLVIGRRPRGSRVSAHLGATSHSVLHRSLVPVAVVPHE